LDVINFTPGTGTNADYTTPEMKNYKSSEIIFNNLLNFENKDGLNGSILLIHPGTEATRKDKFYLELDELIENFKEKGYSFQCF
jgi:endoglucanase